MNLDHMRPGPSPWQLGGVLPAGISFEFPEGTDAAAAPAGDGAATAVVDPPAPEAAGGDTAAPETPGGAAAPEYLTPDHPAFQTVLNVSQQLGQALEEARTREADAQAQAQASGEGLPELDFTDPTTVLAHAEHAAEQRMTTMLQEALEPIKQFLPIIQNLARDQGEKITTDLLEKAGVPETIGEGENQVKPREMATKLAAAYMRGGMDPDAAVDEAAAQIKQLLNIAGTSAVGEHVQRATELRNVVAAPGAGNGVVEGGNGERPDPLRPSRYSDVVRASLSATTPRQPGT